MVSKEQQRRSGRKGGEVAGILLIAAQILRCVCSSAMAFCMEANRGALRPTGAYPDSELCVSDQ
jgi:hypothetical protein